MIYPVKNYIFVRYPAVSQLFIIHCLNLKFLEFHGDTIA